MSFWRIISKFIGQDLTRVSMPVILNEPLSGLQRQAEMILLGHEVYERAALEEDPVKRMALCAIGLSTVF